MFRKFASFLLLASAACAGTHYGGELRLPVSRLAGGEPASRVWVDRHRHEVVVVAGPFTVQPTMMKGAAGMGHMEHGGHDAAMKSPLIPLAWPVDGGLRGFRLGLFSADGTPLPRTLIHHLNTLDFDRRELLYPVPTRLIAIGSETPDIKLPSSHQVLLERGDSLGWYVMWHNESKAPIENVYVELVLPYGEPEEALAAITTIYMDTNLVVGEPTTFDVPPGRSEHAYEFELPTGGRLLGAGGHLHDYGVEVRLEDVESGDVIVRLKSDRDAEGRVSSVEQKIFRRFFDLFDASIPLEANHPYRIVGVYDNPTGRASPIGGMAQIGGLFTPDDMDDWPRNDRSDPAYQLDLSGLPQPLLPADTTPVRPR